MICNNCPHGCDVNVSFHGICKAKGIANEKIRSLNYGQVTSIALKLLERVI